MKKYLNLKSLRISLLTMLVLLLCSPVLAGSPAENSKKKPAIGLIQFSLDVHTKKETVERIKKKVEEKIVEFLKKAEDSRSKKIFDFENSFYFKDDQHIITYSDIEDPDVTIDPTLESRSNKILKELSGKHQLDAIVFGHFQEEEDFVKDEKNLVIVFRYYIADNNIPKDRRIISLKPVKIQTDKITKDKLEEETNSLIEGLKKKLKIQFAPPPKKVEEGLTAKDVYQMIIDKGFHCETLSGSPIHDEAMKALNKPKTSTFNLKRKVSATIISGEVIGTQSKKFKLNKEIESNIELQWNVRGMEFCNYERAMKKIKQLNQKDKNKKWRIPTVMELFSIIDPKNKDNFPAAFGFQKKYSDSLVFWTSTVLKKEGTELDYNKKEKAHIVVTSGYDKTRDNYWVYFSYKNINNRRKKAILLPVYSEREPGVDLISTDKIPGFDDYKGPPVKQKGNDDSHKKSIGNQTTSKNSGQSPVTSRIPKPKAPPADKIPGFDDVPVSSKANKTSGADNIQIGNKKPKINKSHGYNRTNVNILVFPFIDDEELKKSRFVFPPKISEVAINALKELENKVLGDLNCKLDVNLFDKRHIKKINRFYSVVFDPMPGDGFKLSIIKDEIINIPKIDIVVAGKFNNYLGQFYFVDSYVIDLINNEIFPERSASSNPEFRRHEYFIKKKVYEIIEKNLTQR